MAPIEVEPKMFTSLKLSTLKRITKYWLCIDWDQNGKNVLHCYRVEIKLSFSWDSKRSLHPILFSLRLIILLSQDGSFNLFVLLEFVDDFLLKYNPHITVSKETWEFGMQDNHRKLG